MPHPAPSHRARPVRRAWALVAVAAALPVLAVLVHRVASRPDREAPRVSGAYKALGWFTETRAYPGRDLPPAAWGRAHAYARDVLARRALPLAKDPRGRTVQAAAWQAIGPVNGGGRTLALAIDPSAPDVIYAGSASGGLWRSATGGVGAAAWQRVETGHPVLAVSSIALQPGDSDVIYIGTGEVYNVAAAGTGAADRATRGSYGIGILKSVDGGATWAPSLDWSYDQRHGVWAVRIDPGRPQVVWAATTDGVYKSENAGADWSRVLAVAMANDLVIHPTRGDTVLAACGNLSSPGRGIYRTVDGGATWALQTAPAIPASFAGKVQFGVTPANPDLVFASIGNGFSTTAGDNFTWLLRSADFGASWALRSTTDYSRWQGWFSHDVAVSPVDTGLVICAGIDIWRSTNGGTTLSRRSDWRNYFRGDLPAGGPEGTSTYSHADHHDIVWHPTQPNTIYFANDGGVFRSVDGGTSFHGVNGGYQSQQFYNGTFCSPTDPGLAMGGLQDNGSAIYRGGTLWSRWVLGGDGGWCAIDPANTSVVIATAQELILGRSTDGGGTFTLLTPPATGGPTAFIAPMVMSPVNPQVIYGGRDKVLKTFDGGFTWFQAQGGAVLDGNPVFLLALAADSDSVIYAVTAPYAGNRGRAHRSLDGGAGFSEITGTLPDRYPGDLAVDPTDRSTIYLTMLGFGSSHVFKSVDAGATWQDLDGGQLPDVPTGAVAVDPDFPHHVYVGNDLGVYFTPDAGTNWYALNDGLPSATMVFDLNVSRADRKLRAFTHGLGVFERPLLGELVEASGPVADAGAGRLLLLPGMPNPFRDRTTLAFDLPSAGRVELAVHDLRGARVRTLGRGERAAGRHTVAWDGRNEAGRTVAPGTYFVRLTAGGRTVGQSIQRVR